MQRATITFLKAQYTETEALEEIYKTFKYNFKILPQKHSMKYWIFSIEGHDVILKVKRFKNDKVIKRILK